MLHTRQKFKRTVNWWTQRLSFRHYMFRLTHFDALAINYYITSRFKNNHRSRKIILIAALKMLYYISYVVTNI
jgi:hypothetical protein